MLVGRSFLGDFCHKFFPRNNALFNQQFCERVSLGKTGNEQLFRFNQLLNIDFRHSSSESKVAIVT